VSVKTRGQGKRSTRSQAAGGVNGPLSGQRGRALREEDRWSSRKEMELPLVSRLLFKPKCSVFSFFPNFSPGDSSEVDETPHSVHPYGPPPARKSDPPYVGRTPSPSATTESTEQSHPYLSHPPPEDPLGTLPDNWEMAFTENGEVYFIE